MVTHLLTLSGTAEKAPLVSQIVERISQFLRRRHQIVDGIHVMQQISWEIRLSIFI